MHFLISLALLSACSGEDPRPAAPTTVVAPAAGAPARFEAIVRVTGGARETDTLPMVVAVHGLGDTPEGFAELFDDFAGRARIVVPRAPEPYHGGFGWFPFDTSAATIGARADQLAEAIQTWRARYPTRGAPVLTGFSQGGMLSFAVAVRRPEVIAAAFPVSGRLPASLVPATAPPGTRLPPIRAMHGTEDRLIEIGPTRAVVEMLRTRGFAAEPLREHAGVGHTITPAMQDELYRWITAAIGE